MPDIQNLGRGYIEYLWHFCSRNEQSLAAILTVNLQNRRKLASTNAIAMVLHTLLLGASSKFFLTVVKLVTTMVCDCVT